jgi:hypothetical protein
MRLKIAKILPLAFADTLRQIRSAEKNEPEHLSTLYLRFGSILKQIREKRGLTIQGLSVLSGVPEELLEAAESGTVEMTDGDCRDMQRVYWSLSALVASPGDYRRLLAEMSMKANED